MKNLKRALSILICIMMLTSVAFAANTSIVEYTTVTDETTGATTVTATSLANGVTDKDVNLFTAVYDNEGNLITAKKASTEDSLLLKNSVPYADGQIVKSFTWEGEENTPIEAIASYGKNTFTEEDVEITFGGVSFEEYLGSALAFDATDNVAEYTVKLDESKIGSDGNITIFDPEVKVKDNSIGYKVVNDEEALTSTITFYLGRDVSYDESYAAKSKETYSYAACETVVINYKMTMFTEDMIEEKVDGFVDFNGNKTSYDNIYTYDLEDVEVTVENSPAIQGKTAVLSAINVDGVPLEGFSPDVFEYTVTVNAAQAMLPAVTFVAAGDAVATKTDTYTLPGKTEIAVTEGSVSNKYEINYAFASEIVASNVAFKDSTITELYRSFYEPGGVQIGSKVYVDRVSTTNYDIKEINDSSLIGADLIRGSIDCYGSKNSIYEGEAISDWITFDIPRGATVVILSTESYGKANFEDNDYVYEKNDSGYLKTYTNAEKVFIHSYTKHFDANTTATIPNVAANAGHTILAAVIWDDWAEPAQEINDITITADKFSKATIVVLVPHDKTKDSLVAKDADGEYSEVVWTEDKEFATDAYDYETDGNGNVVYNGFDAERSTGKRYNREIATMNSGTSSVTVEAFKQFVENDGHYVYGSQVSRDRYPKSGNRMSIMNIPDEYEGSNGIVYGFNSSGHTDVTLDFSANENLDKIVIMSLDAITNLKANGEDVFTQTVPATADQAYYMYQGITSGKVATAEFTMSYHIAKGNMYAHDIASQNVTNVSEGYTYWILRRAIADFLKENIVGPDADKMSDELYTIATTAERDSWQNHKWFFGDVVFTAKGDLVENLTYVGPATHEATKNGEIVVHETPAPVILDFNLGAYSDRVSNVSSATGNKAGEPLSYPQWLDVENATYIAGAYEWTSLPGCHATVFENTAAATDWYTFEVTEDATVMLLVKDAPTSFWATEDGWAKAALEGDDVVNVCRTKTGTALFQYNNLFVKDVKKGDTVVIKSPQMKGIIPLVFVKPAK